MHIRGVHLTGVHFTSVHLTGVHLTGAHFTGLYLRCVRLMGVHPIRHVSQGRTSHRRAVTQLRQLRSGRWKKDNLIAKAG